jgi:hypothetical protein
MDKNLSLVSYLRASTTTARYTVFDFENLNVTANFPLICICSGATEVNATDIHHDLARFGLPAPRRD